MLSSPTQRPCTVRAMRIVEQMPACTKMLRVISSSRGSVLVSLISSGESGLDR
jgi:hypothetical protein